MQKPFKRSSEAREPSILIPLALIVTLISTFWAWKLAANQFVSPPVSAAPGAIYLATYGHSSNQNPIIASVVYEMSYNKNKTQYLQLSVEQKDDTTAKGTSSFGIILFLCGEAAINPDFTSSTNPNPNFFDLQGKKVIWRNASTFYRNVNYFTLFSEFPTTCIYSMMHFTSGGDESNGDDPSTGYGDITMDGNSGLTPSKVSGAEVSYVWPGILNVPNPVSNGKVEAVPLPSNSRYTADFFYPPGDISDVVTSPPLTQEPAGYTTEGSINDASPEFRLTGELADSQIHGQEDLFIAGALVGVAGAGAIWFLEMLVKTLLAMKKSSTESSEVINEVTEKGRINDQTGVPQLKADIRQGVRIFRRQRRQ
jgi:hypothetical protein